MEKVRGLKGFSFTGYEDSYIIQNYIVHKLFDTVHKRFDECIDAICYMDDNDLWDDYYIYYINDEGVAHHPDFR